MILNSIVKENILSIEESREKATWKTQKGLIKKRFRRYRIQPKVRFIYPFHRFGLVL